MNRPLYLHFKAGESGPFQTIPVMGIDSPLWHHKQGLQYTRTGYGSRIPTRWKVRFAGRLYRVYCTIYSNIGTCWIRVDGEKVTVQD